MRTLLINASASILLLGFVFWAYRGAQVFVRQQVEYRPTPYDVSDRDRRDLARAVAVSQQVGWSLRDGSKQNAFYFPTQNGAVIVYAHGSPGNALGALDEALELTRRGYGVLLIDLPGYGASQGGRAWDASFVESIRRGVDFALAQPGVDPKRIGGFGYSNGGCLMARAASEDGRLSTIILLATYTNLADQLHHAFRRPVPGMGYFALASSLWSGVPVSELDTIAALRRMKKRPTLVIAGAEDHAIPVGMADHLKRAVPEAEMILFEQVGHLDFAGRLGDVYFDALVDFWDSALGAGSNGSRRTAGQAESV